MAASIKLISPAGGSVTLTAPMTTDNFSFDIGGGTSLATLNVSNNLVVGGSANVANLLVIGTSNVGNIIVRSTANIVTANITGNLTFTGTSQRITGDFTNTLVPSRVIFQTSNTNSSTGIYAVPSGSSTAASWQAANTADPTNASKILIATNGSTDVQLVSGINGTGTYLPLTFYNSGSEKMRLSITGGFSVGTTTDPGAGYISDIIGNVRSVPQNAQTSSYILVASDNGKHISITTGGVTINSGIHSVGDTITIFNNSSSSQTITQGTSVTLRQSATTNTGNRTLAGYGICTILCVAANTFVITGSGLT